MGFYRKPLEEVVPANVEIIHRAPDLYHTTATDSLNSSVSVRQQNGQLTYVPTEQFALTSSNHFRGNQIIDGNLNVNGTINVSNLISASIIYESGSTIFGNSMDDYHQFTGSIYITGSTTQIGNNTLIGGNSILGNTTMSGSLEVSGSNTFKGTHVLSGSNSILGNTTMSGSIYITGSTTQIGNNTLIGNTVLSGSVEVSGSTNFHNHTITMTGSMYTSGSQTITGSLDIKGNVNIASGSAFYRWGNKLFNYGQWGSLQTQSGSADTAYPMKLDLQYNGVSGIYIAPGNTGHMTRIYVENAGLYNIQFSAQLHTTVNESCNFSIWFSKDGNNLPNSNTDFTIEKITGGGYMVAALNLLEPINSGSYIELYYSKTTNNGQIQYKPAQSNPTRPATPSLIVTLTQIA